MKKLKKILLIIPFTVITTCFLSGQGITPPGDTLQAGQQKRDGQAKEQTALEAQKQSGNSQQAHNQAGNGSPVKQVNSARPDWSKARGARPASIERPSGSRIPKGVGKPGGVKGPGKR